LSVKLPQFYDDPALYDLIHADGTGDEVWLLDSLAERHGNGGKRALEPACGTGRYLAGLLRRGWTVCGYDISTKMTAYAKKRLSKWGKKALVVRGDMTTFKTKEKFDLAFNTLSTFRHLLTEPEALAHLRSTYDALNPGGIYILGLDLALYGEDLPDEEVWVARRQGRTIKHVMMTLPPDARKRRERIINFVTYPAARGEKVLESSYDLRSYDSGELANLILKTKFSLPACYGYDGRPASLCGTDRALWLILKKKDRR
jgi:SAM-dependent methyltransferase